MKKTRIIKQYYIEFVSQSGIVWANQGMEEGRRERMRGVKGQAAPLGG